MIIGVSRQLSRRSWQALVDHKRWVISFNSGLRGPSPTPSACPTVPPTVGSVRRQTALCNVSRRLRKRCTPEMHRFMVLIVYEDLLPITYAVVTTVEVTIERSVWSHWPFQHKELDQRRNTYRCYSYIGWSDVTSILWSRYTISMYVGET